MEGQIEGFWGSLIGVIRDRSCRFGGKRGNGMHLLHVRCTCNYFGPPERSVAVSGTARYGIVAAGVS